MEDYEVAGVVVIDEDLRGKKIEDVPVVGYLWRCIELSAEKMWLRSFSFHVSDTPSQQVKSDCVF